MRGSWVAGCVGVVLGVAVCLGVLVFVRRGAPEPGAPGAEPHTLPPAALAGKVSSLPGGGVSSPAGTGGVVRRFVPRGGGVTAPPARKQAPAAPGGEPAEPAAGEEPVALEPPPTDYTRAATVTYWLEQLRSKDADAREDAFMHLKQCEAAMAVPGLRTLLQEVEDPRLKVAILDTIQFLELPALPPGMLRLSTATGRTTGRTPAGCAGRVAGSQSGGVVRPVPGYILPRRRSETAATGVAFL